MLLTINLKPFNPPRPPVYPTPLTSVRFRDSVYRETGHTIMNLLAVSNETPAHVVALSQLLPEYFQNIDHSS